MIESKGERGRGEMRESFRCPNAACLNRGRMEEERGAKERTNIEKK